MKGVPSRCPAKAKEQESAENQAGMPDSWKDQACAHQPQANPPQWNLDGKDRQGEGSAEEKQEQAGMQRLPHTLLNHLFPSFRSRENPTLEGSHPFRLLGQNHRDLVKRRPQTVAELFLAPGFSGFLEHILAKTIAAIGQIVPL